MDSTRGGQRRWTAGVLGAVGVAALLAGSTGVAHAGGPVTAQSPTGVYKVAPQGGPVTSHSPDGVYPLGPLPRPGASQGVATAPDPGRQGDPRDWRGRGPDDGRGHGGNWRQDDWRRDDWRAHGYWHGGRWYPYRYYGYSGWRPPYPGGWVWDGWRWVWVPGY